MQPLPLPEALYHYCSTASLCAIVKSHSLWLSSLSLANDSSEGQHISSALIRLAERDKLSPDSRDRLLDFYQSHGAGRGSDGLGFCLSEEGDLLSQWRGYAADGAGVAIGFSAIYLDLLSRRDPGKNPFFLQKVEYKDSGQELLIEWLYRDFLSSHNLDPDKKLYPLAPDGLPYADHESYLRTFGQVPKGTLGDKFSLKHSAFHEEREWRLITPVPEDGSCLYRSLGNRVVPYCTIALEEIERRPSITRVILGPKHVSPREVVENLLKQNGYGTVLVERSGTPYC